MPHPSAWTADELALLRDLAAEGLPPLTIAERLGRGQSSVSVMLSRRGWTLGSEGSAVRDRVVALTNKGWAPSRISRQLGLDKTAIVRLLAIRGVKPASPVVPRPTGRLVLEEAVS